METPEIKERGAPDLQKQLEMFLRNNLAELSNEVRARLALIITMDKKDFYHKQ